MDCNPVADVAPAAAHPFRPPVASLVLFATAYVVAGGFGQGLAIIPGVSITFWPPAGLFVAALLRNRPVRWPWYVLAGGIAELTCNAIWFHNSILAALIYFAANALEALTAAWLIGRFAPRPFRLESLGEVATFVVLGAGMAPMVGATVIAATDAVLGKHPFATAWPLVWLGDGSGLLVTTPLVFVAAQAWADRAKIPARRVAEAVALSLLLLGVGVLACRDALPTAYATMPLLLWAAIRFQLKGAAAALALVTLLTAACTVTGRGEFAGPPELRHEMVVQLQAFLGISAVSALLTAALSQQHQQALRGLSAANADLERRVEERSARLREADRKKDEFLSILAHELRNPLAPLRTGLEVMRLAQGNAGAIEQARAMMERQLAQMVRLIDDLMDLTRISRGKVVLRTARMPLADAVRSAVEASRPLIDQAGHRLTVRLPEEPVFVGGDPTRLAQVFANLLNNAAKYTNPGGRITLTVERQGGDAVVTVEDTGVGIPVGMLPTVFDMFTQVDRSLEKAQGGLGIGLWLVRSLVEIHGGTVVADSAGPGRGSTFIVRLPMMPFPVSEAPPIGDAAPAVSRRRILIADDNTDAAASLGTLLRLLGNEVRIARDGQEAVEMAAANMPDVALFDIGMPRLNGYDACRRLRDLPGGRTVTVIALTGWGQEDDRKRSRDAGFDFHLVKPVDPADLEKLLATLPRA